MMRRIFKSVTAITATLALSVLCCTSVFAAAQTPAEIQEIHQNGMKYLAEINAQRVASEQALKEQTQKDFERGYAELRRAHSIHNDCGIEQEARKGFESGQKYLDLIFQQNEAAAADRDRQAQEGYERGIAYLRQCGWDI